MENRYLCNERDFVFSPNLENKILVDPPVIKMPLFQSGLQELITAMKNFLGDNFMSAAMMVGSLALSLHYETLIEEYDSTPMAIAVGQPQSGKTTPLSTVLSLIAAKIYANVMYIIICHYLIFIISLLLFYHFFTLQSHILLKTLICIQCPSTLSTSMYRR